MDSLISIQWHVKPESIIINRADGSLIITKGDFITFEDRELGAKVEGFQGNDEGPIGMEYLPWRGTRWATPMFGLRGNPRFIICYPIGTPHYGQHIDWNTVKIGILPIVLPLYE